MKYINFIAISFILAVSILLGIKNSYAMGTGFFISNDGYLLTNRHVTDYAITQAKQLIVKWMGRDYPAELIATGKDIGVDLSLLKIDQKTPCLSAGNNKGTSLVGKYLTTVYYDFTNALDPFRYSELNITTNNVKVSSETSVTLEGGYMSHYVLNPAFIRPGNSGSPLVDKDNFIVAVANAVESVMIQPSRDTQVMSYVRAFAVSNQELVQFLTPYRYADNIQCTSPTKDAKTILNTVNP